jgi:hypothetical protein
VVIGTINIFNSQMVNIGRLYSYPPTVNAPFAAPGNWAEYWLLFSDAWLAPNAEFILGSFDLNSPPAWSPDQINALKAEFDGQQGRRYWTELRQALQSVVYLSPPAPPNPPQALPNGVIAYQFDLESLVGNASSGPLIGRLWRTVQVATGQRTDHWRLHANYTPPVPAGNGASELRVRAKPVAPSSATLSDFLALNQGAGGWFISAPHSWGPLP